MMRPGGEYRGLRRRGGLSGLLRAAAAPVGRVCAEPSPLKYAALPVFAPDWLPHLVGAPHRTPSHSVSRLGE